MVLSMLLRCMCAQDSSAQLDGRGRGDERGGGCGDDLVSNVDERVVSQKGAPCCEQQMKQQQMQQVNQYSVDTHVRPRPPVPS